MTARGQYGPGLLEGKPVPGYREEESVDPNSTTETYSCVKFFIDNWRWADVPFYLRSGKRLARKHSEIAVKFRGIPHRIFGEAGDQIETNTLVMKIQPDEGVSIRFNAKVPGPKMHIRGVTMDFNYGTGFGVVSAPAYERLIADAMRGDATLFTRWDAVECAWVAVMPILNRWQATQSVDFPNYLARQSRPAVRRCAARGRRPGMEAHLMSVHIDSATDSTAILKELHHSRAGGGDQGTRVATMNFIVFVDDPAHRVWVLLRAQLVAQMHPCRLIVLDSTNATTGVEISSATRDDGGATIVNERVQIGVSTLDHGKIINLVQRVDRARRGKRLVVERSAPLAEPHVFGPREQRRHGLSRFVGQGARRGNDSRTRRVSQPFSERSRSTISPSCASCRGKI